MESSTTRTGRIIRPVPDAKYADFMKNEVLPGFEKFSEELYIARDPENRPERKLHLIRLKTAGEPRAVILIAHGFTESSLKFREMGWYFREQGFEAYLIDHAGHGKSFRLVSDPNLVFIDRWQTYADDLLFAADEIKKAHPSLPLYLFGHSMGGGICAAAAAKDGEEGASRFAKVVLSSPMIEPLLGMPVTAGGLYAWTKKIRDRYDEPVPGYHPFAGDEKFENSAALSPARFEEYLDLQRQNVFLQTCFPTFGWVGEAVRLTRYLAGKAPKNIKVPVLLCQAGKDAFVSNKAQEKFISRVADGRMEVFPESKHEIYRSTDSIMADYYEKLSLFLQ